MSYITLDYLRDLTASEKANAGALSFAPYSGTVYFEWDQKAGVSGSEPYALLHSIYTFVAVEGAEYDIFSTSYFDPYIVILYDQYGNAIEANLEDDDPSDFQMPDGGLYSQDVIWSWTAPYTGTYYVEAGWNQGNYYSYYSLNIYADMNTAVTDRTPPLVLAFSPADGTTAFSPSTNIVVTFNETVQRGAGYIVLKTTDGQVVETYDAATSFNIEVSGNTLLINPTFDLSFGTEYSLTVTAGSMRDLAGNAYSESASYNFETTANKLFGTAQADSIVGIHGKDVMVGLGGNDTLTGLAGNDSIDGGTGIDLAIYGAARSAANIARTPIAYTVSSALDGTDTVINIERLQFNDGNIALDVESNQSAGQTALLLGAVLPGQLVFDPSKEVLLGAVIDLFDQGYSLKDLSGAVLRLPVWDVLTGKIAPTSLDIADYLLRNVNGVNPDQNTLNAATNALNTEVFQGEWLANLASSAANQIHVGLVGLQDTGLEYFASPG